MLAIENDNINAVDLLIQHKASVNAQDRHGMKDIILFPGIYQYYCANR